MGRDGAGGRDETVCCGLGWGGVSGVEGKCVRVCVCVVVVVVVVVVVRAEGRVRVVWGGAELTALRLLRGCLR